MQFLFKAGRTCVISFAHVTAITAQLDPHQRRVMGDRREKISPRSRQTSKEPKINFSIALPSSGKFIFEGRQQKPVCYLNKRSFVPLSAFISFQWIREMTFWFCSHSVMAWNMEVQREKPQLGRDYAFDVFSYIFWIFFFSFWCQGQLLAINN